MRRNNHGFECLTFSGIRSLSAHDSFQIVFCTFHIPHCTQRASRLVVLEPGNMAARTTTPQPTNSTAFFSLPPEIRLNIYQQIFWIPRTTRFARQKVAKCHRRSNYKIDPDRFQPQNVCAECRHELLRLYTKIDLDELTVVPEELIIDRKYWECEHGREQKCKQDIDHVVRHMVIYINPLIDSFQSRYGLDWALVQKNHIITRYCYDYLHSGWRKSCLGLTKRLLPTEHTEILRFMKFSESTMTALIQRERRIANAGDASDLKKHHRTWGLWSILADPYWLRIKIDGIGIFPCAICCRKMESVDSRYFKKYMAL